MSFVLSDDPPCSAEIKTSAPVAPHSGQFSAWYGQRYGGIPYSELAKKHEVTPMNENAYQLDNHFRETLSDRTVEPRTLESEQVHDNRTNSTQFLNLRHFGNRSGKYPDHSEIFLELTEKDPRESFTDPDYKKIVDQAWRRREHYKENLYPHEAPFITGGRISEAEEVKRNKDMFYWVKDNHKIFTTSYDGRTTGTMPWFEVTSLVGKTTADEEDMGGHLNTELARTIRRPNKTVVISNKGRPLTNLSRQTTNDHLFKVAKYGDNPRKALAPEMKARKLNEVVTVPFYERKETRMPQHAYVGLLLSRVIPQEYQHIFGEGKEGHHYISGLQEVQDKVKILYETHLQQKRSMTKVSQSRRNPYKEMVKTLSGNLDFVVRDGKTVQAFNSQKMGKTPSDQVTMEIIKSVANQDSINGKHSHENAQRNPLSADTALARVGDNSFINGDKSINHKIENMKSHVYSGKGEDVPVHQKERIENEVMKVGVAEANQANYTSGNLPSLDENQMAVTDNRYGSNTSKNRHIGNVGTKQMFNYRMRDSAERIDSTNGISDHGRVKTSFGGRGNAAKKNNSLLGMQKQFSKGSLEDSFDASTTKSAKFYNTSALTKVA